MTPPSSTSPTPHPVPQRHHGHGRRSLQFAASMLLAGVTVIVAATSASATWSVVGVDDDTGEVGVAVASCVPAAALGPLDEPLPIVAVVPGVGAGVSQALANFDVPPRMEALLAQGSTSAEIIDAVIDPSFDPSADERQHAVVTVDGRAATHTGAANIDVAADAVGDGIAAQGNLLVGREVVEDARAAFDSARDRPLADRLVAALVAGGEAGGDARCGAQTALFAHLVVAQRDDVPGEPSLVLTVAVPDGDRNPVTELAELHESGASPTAPADGSSVWPFALAAVGLLAAALVAARWMRRRPSPHSKDTP